MGGDHEDHVDTVLTLTAETDPAERRGAFARAPRSNAEPGSSASSVSEIEAAPPGRPIVTPRSASNAAVTAKLSATHTSVAAGFAARAMTAKLRCDEEEYTQLASPLTAAPTFSTPPAVRQPFVDDATASASGDFLLPLTAAQRGVWVGEKISRSGTVLNIAEALEIDGAMDPRAFRQAIRQVADEAEAVRVNIIETDDGPQQLVRTQYRWDAPCVDFSAAADPEKTALDWMAENVTKSLNVERDALWAAALVRIASNKHYIFHRAHHIVMDGFGGGLLLRRIVALYNAIAAGETLPENPYAPLKVLNECEEKYRASKAFTKDRDYWVEKLSEATDPVSLAHGKLPTENGLARERLTLDANKASEVRALASELSVTVPQALIALVAAFVHKSTGCNDLVLGMPVSARSKAMRSTPGMAANGVLLRIELQKDDDFGALAARTAREVRTALRHQFYRAEDMRRDQGMTGQHQQVARFAVNVEPFDYQLTVDGAETKVRNLANSSVDDMVVFIYDRGDGGELVVDFDANPSLYSKAELIGHKERFSLLVDEILTDHARPLSQIDLLTQADRQLLLDDYRGKKLDTCGAPVFRKIATLAKENPKAVALREDGRSVTYGALTARAAAVGRHLAEAGVGVGDFVVLNLPRGADLVAASMGANSVGAAFVPLSMADPLERRLAMIDDVAPRAVIHRDDALSIALLENVLNIDIAAVGEEGGADALSEQLFALPDEHYAVDGPAAAAYGVFTSGSTGRPKAALNGHDGLASMIAATLAEFSVSSADRVMWATPPSFDVSVLEVYSALAAGATLIVTPPEASGAPAALGALMRRERATVMYATPGLYSALIAARAAPFQGMRIFAGGDVLTSRLARSIHDLGADLYNVYGPTEACVHVCFHRIDSDFTAPPIGRALPNCALYILDEDLKLVPPGCPGELCIGGRQVALGYINRPALTAEKFPKNVDGLPPGRIYRTGDMARWREDGALEFLGRNDRQLKIRGFRIEPGEVESALLACAGVREALVDACDAPAGKQLVGYVTAKDDSALDAQDLRKRVAAQKPDYLVPARVFVLEEMPLTRNGKIDRRRLPVIEERECDAYVAPRTDIERRLAEIFERMLSVERIGMQDNFFDLGADSLTAVQLLCEIEEEFQIELSLISLFDAPTIENLATQMENADERDPFGVLFPLRKKGVEEPLFCIHSNIGVGWSYSGLLRHIGDRRPLYALQARGLRAGEAAAQSVEDMAADYVAEIRKVQPDGKYRLLGWSLGGLTAHAIAGQLEAMGEEVEYLALLDAFPYAKELAAKSCTDQELAEIALRFLDLSGMEGKRLPTSMSELTGFLYDEFDIFSTPLVAKAGLADERLKERFKSVIGCGFEAAQRYQPQKIEGDITVFRATSELKKDLQGVLENEPGAWGPYTAGRVIEHDIDCGHFAMLNAEPLLEIGPKIRSAL